MPKLKELIAYLQNKGYGVQVERNKIHCFCWLWRPWGIVAIGIRRTRLAAVQEVIKQVHEQKTIPAHFDLN